MDKGAVNLVSFLVFRIEKGVINRYIRSLYYVYSDSGKMNIQGLILPVFIVVTTPHKPYSCVLNFSRIKTFKCHNCYIHASVEYIRVFVKAYSISTIDMFINATVLFIVAETFIRPCITTVFMLL